MQPPQIEIIAGKYRLLRKLGQGGMGSVWYAEHLTLRSPVAIKLIDPAIADNAEALGRFLREAQSAASLRSPHVVQILDHGVDNGVPYIAMELLDGESLADRLERVRRLSPGETARILQHVARAIGRAHEAGIVHRDLKPDNIYLVRNDDDEIAKVLDFGIAKSNSHGLGAPVSGATRTGAVLGTPYYMSPEQAEGAKTLDGRADIWAMGVIAFECLLGSRPFDEETLGGLLLAICARPMPVPSQRGPAPPGFDQWFAMACARDVTQRFSNARDAAAGLRQVCAGAAAGDTGNFTGAPNNAGGYLSSSTPGLAQPNPITASVSGQSLPGFSSTQVGQPAGVPRKGSTGLILALIGAGVLVSGGVLAWTQLGRGTPAVASASASPTVSAAPPIAPVQTPANVPPTPSATPTVIPSEQGAPSEPAASAAQKSLAAAHPVAAGSKPRAGATHVAAAAHVGAAPAAPPVVAPPPPATAAKPAAKPTVPDTNLGI